MPYLGNTTTSFNVDSNNINNGSITTEKIAAGAVVNADVNDSASIAGTKISADFGAQDLIVDTNLLFVDVSTDRVGVGTSSPQNKLTVDTDIGIYRSSSDPTLNFSVGGTISSPTKTYRLLIDDSDSDKFQLRDGSTARLTVDGSGNVGVGTTSPSALLHVAGANSAGMAIFEDTAGTNKIGKIFGYAGGLYLQSRNDTNYGEIVFRAENSGGTAERMRIDSSGRVGIGTSSPGQLLSLKTTGGETQLSLTSDTNQSAAIYLGDTDSVARGYIQYDNSVDALKIASAGSERLRIDSSGRVGIGTTSPGGVLQVREGTDANLIFDADGTETAIQAFNDAGSAVAPLRLRASEIKLITSSTERARIDSSGRLLVGTSSYSGNATILAQGHSGASTGPAHVLLKLGNNAPSSGGDLGYLFFSDSNSSGGFASWILGQRDGGTWTSGSSMPGRLVFSTTADGASSPTERMRIESNGDTLIGTTDGNAYGLVDGRLNVVYPSTASASTHCIKAFHTNTSYAEGGGGLFFLATRRSANSGFNFGGWYTGNDTTSVTSDRQFQFRGDGNGYCDGSWTGGGADYAEYFEWSDGNTNAEDRRGISVVLDGNKIREAVAGEEPIGVVSGNPSIVGDAGWNKWVGKYLRDDFGTYIWEDYNPVDDDGNPKQDDDGNLIIQQRQKLNPDYNPDVEYINREDRSEWDAVGLMGKLRIRKGQVTGARWIKMRDVSDNVEEWLVR